MAPRTQFQEGWVLNFLLFGRPTPAAARVNLGLAHTKPVYKARQRFYDIYYTYNQKHQRILNDLFTWHTFDLSVSVPYGILHQTRTHYAIKVLKNRTLRRAKDALWYVENITIYGGVKLPFSKETLHRTYSYHSTLTLFKLLPLKMPPAIQHRRLKRKRRTDILTPPWQHKGNCRRVSSSNSSTTWF